MTEPTTGTVTPINIEAAKAIKTAKKWLDDGKWSEAAALITSVAGKPEKPALQILDASSIFARLEPVKWIVQALDLCPGAPSLFAGYGYSGKSMVLQSMALAIAAGEPVWGGFTASNGPVMHFDWEQGQHLTRLRYQRLAYARDITPQDLDGKLFAVCHPGFYLDDPEAEGILMDHCEGKELAIFDSFRAACRHTEENSSEARVPLDMLSRVSERTGCVMAMIHHARKPTKDAPGGARETIRGSGALYDACGSVFVLEGQPDGSERSMHHVKARVSGKVQETMTLCIEDVGEPMTDGSAPGLRVTVSRAPSHEERTRAANRAVDEKLKTAMRQLFKTARHQTSVEAMASTLGIGVSSARYALKLLVAAKEVTVSGATSNRSYEYVGD